MDKFKKSAFLLYLCMIFCATTLAHPSYVVTMDNKGQVYFSDLKKIWKIGSDGKMLVFVRGKHSHALMVDDAGNLYGEHLVYISQGERWKSSIWKATPDGTVLEVIPPTDGFLRGYSFVRDAAGNSYQWDGNNIIREALRSF